MIELPWDHPKAALQRATEWVANEKRKLKELELQRVSVEARLKRARRELREAEQFLIPRGRNETPIRYFRRTGRVDGQYTRVCNGMYYCNPAHCKRTWKDKKERDKHLEAAYAILS